MLLDLLNMRAVSAYRGDGLVDSHRRLYKSWLHFRIQWSRKAATPRTRSHKPIPTLGLRMLRSSVQRTDSPRA